MTAQTKGPSMGLSCWNCGRDTGISGKPTRVDHCGKCLADLKCCRGCRFYDPTAAHHCRERIDETVKNKEKANFCDFFQPRVVGARALDKMANKEGRKKSFDDLFKD
jgi:hypothetical protein